MGTDEVGSLMLKVQKRRSRRPLLQGSDLELLRFLAAVSLRSSGADCGQGKHANANLARLSISRETRPGRRAVLVV
jgi:hypothetical protein